MFKKCFLFCFLGSMIVLGLQIRVFAENPDLPKAPSWEFGKISVAEKAGVEFNKEMLDPRYDNQTVINSWGYKAGSVDEIKGLVPEPFYNVLKHPEIWGDFRINETAYIYTQGPLYQFYVEATEKYKGESYIDEDGWLRNYTAGMPFPDVDMDNDPQAALKLVWNWNKRHKTDDDWSKNTTIELVDRSKRKKFVISEMLRMRFYSRFVHDSKPHYEPNPSKLESMYTSINKEPYQVAGTIAVVKRYDIPNRNDDMWVYIPSLRRVRRMSTAERQDKMSGGKDFVWDSTETFDGFVSNYDFEYLGTKEMLLPHCFSNIPSNVSDGYLGGVDDYWQRRKTYLMRATPKDPANISAIYFYVDAEEFRSNIGYVADTKGRPWLLQFYGYHAQKDGGVTGINSVAIDLITRHASKNWSPDVHFAIGLKPKDISFEELKKRYLVR